MSVETRTHQLHGKSIRYQLDAEHSQQARAERVADIYMDVIVDTIVNQPRSLQKRLGPSEMGVPCDKALLHKLNQDPEPERRDIPWKPTIGTAVHAYLEEAFNGSAAPTGALPGRWLTERRVTVGKVGGEVITGSCDLFDTWEGVVLDHKIIGNYTLKKYRSHGPSEQYRRQAHLYGKGWEDAGHKVNAVAICFLPRQGELTDAFIWTDPYDRAVAEETIAHCDALANLLATVGIEQAMSILNPPNCGERFCAWCNPDPWDTPKPAALAANGAGGIWDQI